MSILERRDKKVQSEHGKEGCAYVKSSLKVWQDFSHVISDHRLALVNSVYRNRPHHIPSHTRIGE